MKSFLTLTKKQAFLFSLFIMELKDPFVFSDIERKMGFKGPQPDLRIIFSNLIEKRVVNFCSKERNGYNNYKIDNKKLKNLIEESDLYNTVEQFIHKKTDFAMT